MAFHPADRPLRLKCNASTRARVKTCTLTASAGPLSSTDKSWGFGLGTGTAAWIWSAPPCPAAVGVAAPLTPRLSRLDTAPLGFLTLRSTDAVLEPCAGTTT